MLLRVEVNPQVRLELEGSDIVGFERSAMVAERDLRPAMWAELLEAFQVAVLDHMCGAQRWRVGETLPSGVLHAGADMGSGAAAAGPGAGSC